MQGLLIIIIIIIFYCKKKIIIVFFFLFFFSKVNIFSHRLIWCLKVANIFKSYTKITNIFLRVKYLFVPFALRPLFFAPSVSLFIKFGTGGI